MCPSIPNPYHDHSTTSPFPPLHLCATARPSKHTQDQLDCFRAESGLSIQMRIGIHVGTVVRGVVGSQSPRFCEKMRLCSRVPRRTLSVAFAAAGVLGDAAAIAEHLEAHAAPNTVSCSVAARAAYLSSGYSFTPSESILDAFSSAPLPPNNLRASGQACLDNDCKGRRLSAPSLGLSNRRVIGFAHDAFTRFDGGAASRRNLAHQAQESSQFTGLAPIDSQIAWPTWADPCSGPAAYIVQAAARADAAMA